MSNEALTVNAPVPSGEWKRTMLRGYGSIAVILVGLLLWSTIARLDAGVLAPGTIGVDSNIKTVQHLEGGIVGEILVRDGDVVHQGDVLLRLDPTRNSATTDALRKQEGIARMLEARMLAQREQREKLVVPSEVTAMSDDPTVAAAISDNTRQFESRMNTYMSASQVLQKQKEQIRSDADQARSDKYTAEQQLKTIARELPPLKELFERGLVPLPRITALERQQQQLEGVVAKADIDLARSVEKLAELDARSQQLRQEYVQEAANALPDIRKTLSDVTQQLLVATDALRRIDITAPVDGTVQQLRIFTVGGVLRPGDPILDIAPSSGTLVVRGRVSPIDIDRIRVGIPAIIQLPQFQRYRSETIRGSVKAISKDTLADDVRRDQRYYALEVQVDRSTVPKDIAEKLVAGMTVDVIVPTQARTVLQYMTAPVLNRLSLAMWER